jgi:predicted house-cleaning noncanonical NTP pyrophosphatase (MazG superfamily)
MTAQGIPRPLRWMGLYHVVMLESDSTKLSPLLDEAINAVLDEIEETLTDGELEELNDALNGLRSRRREVKYSKSGRLGSPDQTKAA